ncbi:DUF72 domain-containing protein [Pseudomonas sp. RIT-PI-AD]|uniref:DUF72 domain-containing protein n=1 Tax=Pseudomonas sp. RIT-PI-AD TaxID=3035294 RepID=UPI0021D8A875|nr:DUF72 domain-containing protein [Pseudomonas sp. RIT-PI-AD]
MGVAAPEDPPIYLGCAGWSLPREQWPAFAAEGTHLQRYASRLNAVELNSSFYRPHRPATYAKWAESVPPGFRFSVKVPKWITHENRLRDCEAALDEFLGQCSQLGDRLGCLLIQLPPSLAYEAATAETFLAALRERYEGLAVIEPRHASWREADELLRRTRIGWVAADPAPIGGYDAPLGWRGLAYYRLHGSPRIYYSVYDRPWLERLAARIAADRACARPVWCIFDNTAGGAAVPNALELRALLGEG